MGASAFSRKGRSALAWICFLSDAEQSPRFKASRRNSPRLRKSPTPPQARPIRKELSRVTFRADRPETLEDAGMRVGDANGAAPKV